MEEEIRTWALEAVREVKEELTAEIDRWKAGAQDFDMTNLWALTIAGVHSLAEVVEQLVREQPTD